MYERQRNIFMKILLNNVARLMFITKWSEYTIHVSTVLFVSNENIYQIIII